MEVVKVFARLFDLKLPPCHPFCTCRARAENLIKSLGDTNGVIKKLSTPRSKRADVVEELAEMRGITQALAEEILEEWAKTKGEAC